MTAYIRQIYGFIITYSFLTESLSLIYDDARYRTFLQAVSNALNRLGYTFSLYDKDHTEFLIGLGIIVQDENC